MLIFKNYKLEASVFKNLIPFILIGNQLWETWWKVAKGWRCDQDHEPCQIFWYVLWDLWKQVTHIQILASVYGDDTASTWFSWGWTKRSLGTTPVFNSIHVTMVFWGQPHKLCPMGDSLSTRYAWSC